MTALDDLENVVTLAMSVKDRSRSEQRSLVALAKKVDRERNAVTRSNPRMRPIIGAIERAVQLGKLDELERHPCTFTDDHGSTCACRQLPNYLQRPGFFPTPEGGWSRLEAETIATWEPS